MRFILDIAVTDPGTESRYATDAAFDSQPRHIDTAGSRSAALRGEIEALVIRLGQLDDETSTRTVTIEGDEVDARWIVRHALHDVTHHLADVAALRTLL